MTLQDDIAAAAGAQLDQTQAGMTQFAALVRGYYQSLVDAGFTDKQAMELATGYQATILACAVRRKKQSNDN